MTDAAIPAPEAAYGTPEAAFAPNRWEKALAIAGFIVLLQTFRTGLAAGASDRGDGSTLFQLVSGLIYLSGFAALLLRGAPAWALRVLANAWPLVLLLLLPLISTVWSDAPGQTSRRAIALLLSSTFAFFLLVRFDLRTFFNLLAWSFGIYVVVGVLAAGLPHVGITPNGVYAGAWRGFTGQKNTFGRTLAIGVALLPVAASIGLTSRKRPVLILSAVCLVLVVLARSATALVAAIASVGIGSVLYLTLGGRVGRTRLRPELGISFLLLAGIVGWALVTFGWTTILEALGRDSTLTGRTHLWQWAIGLSADRWWLGAGYRAFWIDANTKYFFEAFAWNQDMDGNRSDTFAGPEHAHSGYVDTLIELGRLGVATLALTIFWALATLRRALFRGNPQVGFIFAVILSFLLIYAITERSILQQSEDLWFLFTAFYLYATKETLLEKPG
jgi:O-antigen ligase